MRRYTVEVGGRTRVIDVDELAADRFRVLVDGQELEVRLRAAEDVGEAVISPEIVPQAPRLAATAFRAQPAAALPSLRSIGPPPLAAAEEASAPDVRAPMPGAVTAVRVQPGDVVARGQVLVDLEAMKMVNPVRSPREGTVAEVRVHAGETVAFGHVLVTFGEAP